jgi:hypothetical protein
MEPCPKYAMSFDKLVYKGEKIIDEQFARFDLIYIIHVVDNRGLFTLPSINERVKEQRFTLACSGFS